MVQMKGGKADMQRMCAMCATFTVFLISKPSFRCITVKELDLIVLYRPPPGLQPNSPYHRPFLQTGGHA